MNEAPKASFHAKNENWILETKTKARKEGRLPTVSYLVDLWYISLYRGRIRISVLLFILTWLRKLILVLSNNNCRTGTRVKFKSGFFAALMIRFNAQKDNTVGPLF